MNKVIPRLEQLEKNGKSIDAIYRKYETDGVKALTDDELLFFIRHTTKTTGIDYSTISDEELQQIINAEKGAG